VLELRVSLEDVNAHRIPHGACWGGGRPEDRRSFSNSTSRPKSAHATDGLNGKHLWSQTAPLDSGTLHLPCQHTSPGLRVALLRNDEADQPRRLTDVQNVAGSAVIVASDPDAENRIGESTVEEL
jgi:hypothetical protein